MLGNTVLYYLSGRTDAREIFDLSEGDLARTFGNGAGRRLAGSGTASWGHALGCSHSSPLAGGRQIFAAAIRDDLENEVCSLYIYINLSIYLFIYKFIF